jgi:hypothetical protein
MYRRYLFVLFGLCGLFLAYGLYTGASFEPLVGDLTRVGGFAERDYGWNGVEEQFVPPLAEQGSLDGQYPIIVVGDSFSTRTTGDRQTPYGSFWTDFLAADVGLRVGVFNIEKFSLLRIVASPVLERTPPRLFILELSERTLRERLARRSDCTDGGAWVAASFAPGKEPPIPAHLRRKVVPISSETLVDPIADHWRKEILRRAFGDTVAPGRRLPLARGDLFTSRRPGELLIYAEDLLKANWSDADWQTFRCALLDIQRRVMASGQTSFVFVLAPDKSSAYAPWLPPGAWEVDAAPRLAAAAGLRMPRVDLALRAAIAAGTRDVYLPDDSHWSTTGSRIVARSVIEYVQAVTLAPTPAGGLSASR